MLNWLLLAALTLHAGFAALALARLFEPEARAESALLTLLMFWGLLVLPVFALGYANALRPASLAVLSSLVSACVLVSCARKLGARSLASALLGDLLSRAKLVPDAFRICWQARGFSSLALLVSAAMISFTALLTYFAPADESWDGLYYHQPIVGFALQNHGFSLVNLPNTLLAQTVNGYPKFGEAFSLWFTIFTDKTLIEIGGSLAAPGLMLAIFALAKRFDSDRASCIGWAATLLLVPGIYSQLRTTMIDIELWFFALAGVYFVTKPVLRVADAVAALVAAAWVVATKGTGVALVAPLVVVACVRLRRSSGARAWFISAPAVAGIGALAALTLLRNWRAYQNPFWPVTVTIRSLGVAYPGLASLSEVAPDLGFAALLTRLYEHPSGGVHDIIVRGYGYAVPWVVLPLGAVGVLCGARAAALGVARRARDPKAENIMLVALVTLLPLAVSPSFSNVRYNFQVVVMAAIGIAWLGDRGWQRLHEGALASSVVLSLAAFVWSGYLWGLGLDWNGVWTLLLHSKQERASMNFSAFQMPANVASLREAELGPGAVAAFTNELSFIGVLWNDRFSNQVVYVPPPYDSSFVAKLTQARARWVAVGKVSAARRMLEKSGAYELVGPAAQQDKTLVYRRRGATPAPL